MKKKIFIYTYGCKKTGLGHVYRSIALAKHISKKYIIKFIIDDLNISNSVLIENRFLSKIDKDALSIKDKDNSLLIIDIPRLVSKNLIKGFKYNIGLDFFFDFYKKIDAAINLYNHEPSVMSNKQYSGIHYAVLRNDFLNVFPNKTNEEKILVTFGTADPSNNTQYVIPYLENEKANIIVGENFSSNVEYICHASINVIQSPENFEQLMSDSEFVICGGGTTLLESIFLCKPALVIPQTNEEQRFSEYLENRGLCRVAKNELCKEIRDLRKNKANLIRAMREVVVGGGQERIQDIIEGVYG